MAPDKRVLLLISTWFLVNCAAYQAQNEPRQTPSASSASATAPIAERSIGDTAGPVSNREMVDQFARESTSAKQTTLLSQLEIYKQELAEQGKYDCCVRPGCNECVLQRGECHCRIGVEKGGPCCGECTAAWIEGRGDVPGIDKEEILRNLGCYRELYEGGPQIEDDGSPQSEHQHGNDAGENHEHHHSD